MSSPVEELLVRYRAYLVGERGLANGTIENYLEVARAFLTAQFRDDHLDLGNMSVAVVTGFVTGQCSARRLGFARNLLCGLRGFLRFAHLDGLTEMPLAQVVPSAAGWSASGLPRGLPAAEVTRLLASCDRRQAVGRRDYAMLVLLVRLGLRAGEVAGLTLDDLDWRAGEIVVRGKGCREERMPLPVDVGEVIAAYLQRGRADSQDRALFLRAHAPVRGLTSNGVSDVVRAGCARAGLPPVGAHRLRHSAATGMLRAGAPLSEVTQVLRQSSAATTAIYAKVDHGALGALVRPWPGGAR